MNQTRYAVIFYFILALLGLWLVLTINFMSSQGLLGIGLLKVYVFVVGGYCTWLVYDIILLLQRLSIQLFVEQQDTQPERALLSASRYKTLERVQNGYGCLLAFQSVSVLLMLFAMDMLLWILIAANAIGLYLLYQQSALLKQLNPAAAKAVSLSQTELLLYAGFVLISALLLVLGQITLLWALIGVCVTAILALVRWLKLQTWEIVDAHAAPVLSS